MEKIIKEIKLARGILFRNESILLVQDIRPGQGHYFLPGGNVEPGESIKETLPREWQEELGWNIKAGSFLGCLENKGTSNENKMVQWLRFLKLTFFLWQKPRMKLFSRSQLLKKLI